MTKEEILNAMKSFSEIEYNGVIYLRIVAYTYRIIVNKHTGNYRGIYQVELLDKCGHSVTVASPDKVKLFNKGEKNEQY